MRGTAWMAGAAAAALLAAGCGTARSPRPGPGATASRRPAVTGHASGPATITRQQAERLAQGLLARAPVPPGARRLGGPPPRALSRPPGTQAATPSVQLHRRWTIARPATAVYGFALTHVPAGMRESGSGQAGYQPGDEPADLVPGRTGPGPSATARSGSGPGARMARVSQRFVSYQPRRPPPGVAAASLSVSVAAAGPDTAVLRADVQVIWYPPRPAGEYVPATVHAVRITASYLSREARGITRTFTSPAVVSRLAALLNGAHAAPRGAISCPLGQVTYVLAFAPSAKAAPALEAASTGCLILRVSVGNRPQPSLQEPPGLALMLTRMIYGPGGPGGGAVLPP